VAATVRPYRATPPGRRPVWRVSSSAAIRISLVALHTIRPPVILGASRLRGIPLIALTTTATTSRGIVAGQPPVSSSATSGHEKRAPGRDEPQSMPASANVGGSSGFWITRRFGFGGWAFGCCAIISPSLRSAWLRISKASPCRDRHVPCVRDRRGSCQ
jgi:hypothetical protein